MMGSTQTESKRTLKAAWRMPPAASPRHDVDSFFTVKPNVGKVAAKAEPRWRKEEEGQGWKEAVNRWDTTESDKKR
jgi:hypothetical protein